MPVRIERLKVEGGFLDGVDIAFVDGLNVMIGERGTGKTSVIELIRFCLGASSVTDEAQARGHEQARSVLGDGVVRVTIVEGGEAVVLSRTASEESPTGSFTPRAIVLAQNEIEAVGAQPSGRLKLVDQFRAVSTERSGPLTIARLRSLTSEIRSVIDDLESIAGRAAELPAVETDLADALAQQTQALSTVKATEEQRRELQRLQALHSAHSSREGALDASITKIAQYRGLLAPLVSGGLPLDPWPDPAGDTDLLAPVRNEVQSAHDLLTKADRALGQAHIDADRILGEQKTQRRLVEERARVLRVALNELSEGVGAITKRVDELQERKGQLDALTDLRAARRDRLQMLRNERAAAYDELDLLRQQRFEARVAVVQRLNELLGPTINIRVTKSAATVAYVQAIINALRGSGVHYNALAPQLARELSPLELVEAAERQDGPALTAATELTADRAAAVLRALRAADLSDVVAAPIDDAVTMELLDGASYKPTDQLSIGQRCTVVLPILLSDHDNVLLVDQPEDHLDNAFITSTLVETLKSRAQHAQLIFSSHNPNIPVLGDASQVIVLASNGRRGFKLHQGALDDAKTVAFVSSLMEGGAEAFRRRAQFYGHSAAG